MITNKAARKLLDGVRAHQQRYCFSPDPGCECELDHDTEPATHAITFVTEAGALDTAENREYLGYPWGFCGDLPNTLDYPSQFPEVADQMAVIDLATGDCQPASVYF